MLQSTRKDCGSCRHFNKQMYVEARIPQIRGFKIYQLGEQLALRFFERRAEERFDSVIVVC
jgi:hypothetical protein